MSRDADDPVTNSSGNPHLLEIVAERLRTPSRRDVLRGGFGLGVLGWMGGGLLAGCGDNASPLNPLPDASPDAAPPDPGLQRPAALGFAAVAKSLDDVVTVPAGYSYTVLYRMGDPIAADVADFDNNGNDEPASFEKRAGDHHDGMHYFGLSPTGGYAAASSDRGLLCMNHEAITSLFLHPTGQTPPANATGGGPDRTVPEEVTREYFAHGVSIIEVKRDNGTWSYVKKSMFNRRIHTLTPMEISGPLRGKPVMITRYSPDGTRTRGTVNNCANGYTPWGTYLTCEENWAGYFRRLAARADAKENTALIRYGITTEGRERWATIKPDTDDNLYGRWDAQVTGADATQDYRNVANTFGWVVEIDPFDPASVPRKRTALGRFAHEGAWQAHPIPGKPIVYYSGDDSRGEYVYKFVSAQNWDPADANRADRLAVGNKYLDSGKLYVAQFNADGTGRWLELAFGNGGITNTNPAYSFKDQDDVALHSRLAADAIQATRMDRPEWIAVDPVTGEVYLALTNNNAASNVTGRTLGNVNAANPRHYSDPKPRPGQADDPQYGNPNGHIIRWKEPSPEATDFTWDIYVFGAAANANATDVNLSGLTADNDFSSPDGLWFSEKTGVLWIQTDDGAYTDVTNCMMLAALPGKVGDGGTKMITNVDQAGFSKQTMTHVGAAPGAKLRRFLVGPKDCEITGLAETPDGSTLFVNIQHPGEGTRLADIGSPLSTWPSGEAGARPRSATIVITKNGGGPIGL